MPKEVDGVDLQRLDPRTYYTDEQIADMVNTLNKERIEYLKKYPGLNNAIVDSIKV
jgi:phosphoenolpyruvate carboxykinase (ATP)